MVAILTGFLMSLAVIATALLGLALMFDMKPLREQLVRAIASLVGLALAAPLVTHLVGATWHGLAPIARAAPDLPAADGLTPSAPIALAFVVGHAALAALVLVQRFGADRQRRFAEELDRIRRRERVRVPPVGMEALDDDSRVDAEDARTDARS